MARQNVSALQLLPHGTVMSVMYMCDIWHKIGRTSKLQALVTFEYMVCTVLDHFSRLQGSHQPICPADQSAQLVEYRTTVPEVVGSNPNWATTQGL